MESELKVNLCKTCLALLQGREKKYCSLVCYWRSPFWKSGATGKHWKLSDEQRKRASIIRRAIPGFGKWAKGQKFGFRHSEESKRKMSISRMGYKNAYIQDRSQLKTANEHQYDTRYKDWMKAVRKRDLLRCRLRNENCNGRLESHHILGWTEFPNLRYEIENGITLCVFHHPRKQLEVKRLAPVFQALVKNYV